MVHYFYFATALYAAGQSPGGGANALFTAEAYDMFYV